MPDFEHQMQALLYAVLRKHLCVCLQWRSADDARWHTRVEQGGASAEPARKVACEEPWKAALAACNWTFMHAAQYLPTVPCAGVEEWKKAVRTPGDPEGIWDCAWGSIKAPLSQKTVALGLNPSKHRSEHQAHHWPAAFQHHTPASKLQTCLVEHALSATL